MPVLDWIKELLETWGKEKVIAALLVIVGGACLGKEVADRRKLRAMHRHAALDRRQATSDMKIALANKLHTDDTAVLSLRQKIIDMPLVELTKALKSGQFTAVQVLHAFQAKALECTRQTNCVTEPIWEAEEWAKELDSSDDKSGILFGIPFSVKESYNIKGYNTNYGVSKNIGDIAEYDHVMIQSLKSQGAIPFMRTNLPQTMYSYCCSNPVYGETFNPYDCERSPGGSSGGEGALIGMNGSPLGLGSDIAGSLRIPAHFCGICSLKSSSRRISAIGESNPLPGQKGVPAVDGTMARDVDSLVLAMKALLQLTMFNLDCSVAPMPFNEGIYSDKTPLTIGYFEDDGYFTPVPSCRRAVAMAVEALRKAGHKLVPFKVPPLNDNDDDTAGNHLFRLVQADGNRLWFSHFEDEQMDKHLATQIGCSANPTFKNQLKRPFMSPRMQRFYNASIYGILTTRELYANFAKKDDYITKFVKAWEDAKLDGLVCPAFGITAPSNDFAAKLMFLAGTTGLFNLLDFPAGIVKVTNVNEEDEENLEHNFRVKDGYDQMAKEACKDSVGLPVGVQCVALPWREELCLRLMKEIETAFQ
ncbi:vitamin D3 hydroxylase-associated protein-like isoform X1 [Glandiceps talaboti]